MTAAYDKTRAAYVRARADQAKAEANKGKTAHQMVCSCYPLDISSVAHERLAAKVKAKQDDASRIR